jgi:hypothetical protein
MHRPMISTSGPLTNPRSPATLTINQSLGEPPKRKIRRTRHQRVLAIASTQTTKLPQMNNRRRTARPLAPQTRKTSLVAAQMAHGSGRATRSQLSNQPQQIAR